MVRKGGPCRLEWLLADTGIIQRLNRKVSANNERLSTNEMGCGSAPRSGPYHSDQSLAKITTSTGTDCGTVSSDARAALAAFELLTATPGCYSCGSIERPGPSGKAIASTLRSAVAMALARGWSMSSRALSAASDKAGSVRAIRPSCTIHSSSAIEDTASITSSDGSSRNNLASIGRASILPICPRAKAADLATPWFRSSSRSIITEMSSGRRRAQPQALARIPGSGCRSRDRKMSVGRVEPIRAAVLAARLSAGPCTTPRTISCDTACAASRPLITASAWRAARTQTQEASVIIMQPDAAASRSFRELWNRLGS